MKRLFHLVLSLAFSLQSTLSLAATPSGALPPQTQTWSPESKIPQITILGNASTEEIRLAAELRSAMVKEEEFWEERGLPEPPGLDAVVYISDYSKITLQDYIRALNPKSPKDIKEYVIQQIQSLDQAHIATLLNELARQNKVDPKAILTSVVDLWGGMRFGVQIQNFAAAISRNVSMEEIFNEMGQKDFSDNAFFTENYEIDLVELFPKELPQNSKFFDRAIEGAQRLFDRATVGSRTDDPPQKQDPGMVLDLSKLNNVPEAMISRKIVVQPRYLQGPNDMGVTTLNDPSVIFHENGHGFNHNLAKPFSIPRIADEAFADMFASFMSVQSKIGEFFAKASGIVSQRLLLESQKAPPENRFSIESLAQALQEMADRGFIRDMADIVPITKLDREMVQNDAYAQGHPLRTFLWQTFAAAPDEMKDDVREAAIRTIYDFTHIPEILTGRTRTLLFFRAAFSGLSNLLKSAVAGIYVKVANGRSELKPEEVRAKINKYVSEVTLVSARAKAAANKKLGAIGMDTRPALAIDYILPEIIRSFYRNALAINPQLATLVIAKAELAMDAKVVELKAKDSGEPYLFFVRTDLDKGNFIAQNQAQKLVDSLSILKTEITALRTKPSVTPIEESRLAELQKSYASSLEKILEYERTGGTIKLFAAHPILDLAKKAFPGIGRIQSALEEQQLKAALLKKFRPNGVCDLSKL